MKAVVIGLLAETALHPGVGSDGGVIDLPVAREVVTGYPVIWGPSMKGALRSKAENGWSLGIEEVTAMFGSLEDGAGGIGITDARLLLLPVRSMHGHYRWVTCPYILERLQRDMAMAGIPLYLPHFSLRVEEAVGSKEENVFLEELSFEIKAQEELKEIVSALSNFIADKSVCQRLQDQLLVCSDDDFSYLTRNALQINAHNCLDHDTKTTTGGGLWYAEYIPADTLLYSTLLTRTGKEDLLVRCIEVIGENPYLQVGGSETTGCGWCRLAWNMGGER